MDVCRVCLSVSPEKNISQLKTKKNQEYRSAFDIFMFCVNVQVSENSKVSTKLCMKCYKKTIQFYNFKLLALKSDTYLHSISINSDENKIFVRDTDDFVINFGKSDSIDSIGSIRNFEREPEIKVEDLACEELQYEEVISLNNIVKCEAESINVDEIKLDGVLKHEEEKYVAEGAEDNCKGSVKKRGRPKQNGAQKLKKQVCEECGKAVWDIKEHSEMHIPKEMRKRVNCKFCDKTFLTFAARYRHTRQKHLGIRHKCDICGIEVSCLSSHKARKHHPELLKHVCSICGQRFYSGSTLDAHILIHTKERPFKCDVCSKGFRAKIVMLNHKRQVHEKEKSHLCQFCSKSFFKKSHLQIHIRRHTKEKPYKCEECGRSFVSRTTLNHHTVTHSRHKNYHCDLCHMAFVCKNYLRAHMVSHTKEKKHECKYCGLKFGRSDHRKRHEYTAHEKHYLS